MNCKFSVRMHDGHNIVIIAMKPILATLALDRDISDENRFLSVTTESVRCLSIHLE